MLLLIILILIYVLGMPEILAICLMLLSGIFFIKCRQDIYLLFLSIPIVYANYSISMGEFLAKNLRVSLNGLRFGAYTYYVDVLLMLNIFILILTIFIKPKVSRPLMKLKNNNIFFIALYVIILLINIFFFDRSNSDNYLVRTNSVHGYMYLLVLFLIYYSGNNKIKRFAILILVAISVGQSLIFGGRLAILPNIILTLLMLYKDKLKFFPTTAIIMFGIVIFAWIGSIRGGAEVSLSEIIRIMQDTYFVQDTSVYAFNSSVTHVATSHMFLLENRVLSLMGFLASIFIGEVGPFTQMGNVTSLSDTSFNNLGGGIIVTHFYFWLGWLGVILSGFLIVWIWNGLNKAKNDLSQLTLIAITSITSSWYLYSPLQLFRILLFFIPILYYVSKYVDSSMMELKRSR